MMRQTQYLRDSPRNEAEWGQSTAREEDEEGVCQHQEQPGQNILGRPQPETGPPGLASRAWRWESSRPACVEGPGLPPTLPAGAALASLRLLLGGKGCVLSKSQQHTQNRLGAKRSKRRAVTAFSGTTTPPRGSSGCGTHNHLV